MYGNPVHFNACVGNNSWVNINTYIDGYRSATLIMLQSAVGSNTQLEDERFCSVDTAIYPIFFLLGILLNYILNKKYTQLTFSS